MDDAPAGNDAETNPGNSCEHHEPTLEEFAQRVLMQIELLPLAIATALELEIAARAARDLVGPSDRVADSLAARELAKHGAHDTLVPIENAPGRVTTTSTGMMARTMVMFCWNLVNGSIAICKPPSIHWRMVIALQSPKKSVAVGEFAVVAARAPSIEPATLL